MTRRAIRTTSENYPDRHHRYLFAQSERPHDPCVSGMCSGMLDKGKEKKHPVPTQSSESNTLPDISARASGVLISFALLHPLLDSG